MLPAEDFRTLGHEPNAAKDDEIAIFLSGGKAGKSQGVPPKVSKIDHILPLVVMTQDDQAFSERLLPLEDAQPEFFRLHLSV